jgi:hypothetical protein
MDDITVIVALAEQVGAVGTGHMLLTVKLQI